MGHLAEIVDYFVRKHYLFDLPVCPFCIVKDHFRLRRLRLDDRLGVFENLPIGFLDSLPSMPPDVAAEKNRSWLQREFRWFHP